MWICLNNAFFSVVKDNTTEDKLLLRARAYAHIAVAAEYLDGGEDRIVHTPKNDYQFRIVVSREELGNLLQQQVDAIEYPNFKDSVVDKNLSSMYSRVWGLGVQFLDPEMPYRAWRGKN